MTLATMADAAYAANIPPGFDIAAGYIGGPAAYHIWPPVDWERFPGHRLPIWVAGSQTGTEEGHAAVTALRDLGVPLGCITALDMETRIDPAFVIGFGDVLQDAGYRVWPYGSKAFVGSNPPLNGYWVADYTSEQSALLDLELGHVRAVQWATFAGFDRSLVKPWTEGEMWHG